MKKRIAIVGAGLTGATAAYTLRSHGFTDLTVFEQRDHVAGNCHTFREETTGVMMHAYGPHIFHTRHADVWKFVNMFANFRSYEQRTKAMTGGKVFSFPINLHTLNQYFDRNWSPREAEDYFAKLSEHRVYHRGPPRSNFADEAISRVGESMYAAFFHSYTKKQWGRDPHDIPAEVAQRIPVRFTYDDAVFSDPYQGIPEQGYTNMVENMLDRSGATVRLNERFEEEAIGLHWDHVVYTGSIDEAYDYAYGELPYRTLDLKHHVLADCADFQGCSVMNLCDDSDEWTRRTEHKHFTPWEPAKNGTVVTLEYPREWRRGDIRFYPVNTIIEEKTLRTYRDAAYADHHKVTFMGRLGTFRYLNMDEAIGRAIVQTRELALRLKP